MPLDRARSTDAVVVETLRSVALLTALIPVAFLASKLGGVGWRPVTTSAVLVGVVAVFIAARRGGLPSGGRAVVLWTLLGLLALTAIRFLPFASAPAPPGGDMGMHALLARIALSNEVLPPTQVPLYPGVPYGAYPLGFHAIVAWIAGLVGLVGACLFAIAWSQALFAAAILVHAARWVSVPVAIATALVASFAARNPQAYVGWGGNPCVLGFAFALFAVDGVWSALDEPSPRAIGRAALLVAATACTHATAAVTLAIVLVALAVIRVARRRQAREAVVLVCIGVTAVVLVLPWIIDVLATDFSRAEAAWIRQHHIHPPQSPRPDLFLLPDYWKYLGGDAALVLGAMGLVAGCLHHPRGTFLALLSLVALPHLAILLRHSGLPGDTVLYPERALLVLVVPWAYLLTRVFVLAGQLPDRRWRRVAIGLLAVACLGVSVVNAGDYYFGPASVDSVDELDLRSFDALVDRGAERVQNRTGDPAAFLPALRSIPVTRPQWNPIWKDELDAWRRREAPDFIYSRESPDSVAVLPFDASP